MIGIGYKKFHLILTTLAPVHIGSGGKYSAKEFIFERGSDGNSYYFPDMGQLYSYLVKRQLDEAFERFLIDPHNRSKRLIDFLADKKLTVQDWGGYRLPATGFEHDTATAGKLNDISIFVRDGLGRPYIPGSSLKGAIRTILMNTHWKNKDFVSGFSGKEKENKTVIPWGAKKGKAFDDVFNSIRVSDSSLLKNEDLILVQKWDYSIDKQSAKPLPVFREAIAPLKKIEFEITTTSPEAYELISGLTNFSQEWYRLYTSFYLKDRTRKGNLVPDRYQQDNLQYPIYLGAGAGVWTKTVMKQANGIVQKRYSRLKTKMVGKGVLKLTKTKGKTVRMKSGVSRKLIKNEDSYFEMGKACFLLKEVL